MHENFYIFTPLQMTAESIITPSSITTLSQIMELLIFTFWPIEQLKPIVELIISTSSNNTVYLPIIVEWPIFEFTGISTSFAIYL